jgi:hypothetical protein
VFAVIPMGEGSLGDAIVLPASLGNWGGLIVFALLAATLVYVVTGKKKNK